MSTDKSKTEIPGVRTSRFNPFAAIWLALGGVAATGVMPPIPLGFLAFGICVVQFYRELGFGLPIKELAVLIAGLQWMGAAAAGYLHPVQIERYRMYVPEDYYFRVATPAFSLFAAGLTLLRPLRSSGARFTPDVVSQLHGLAIALILGSFPIDLAGRFLPSSLAFFLFLLSQLRYVGLLILLSLKPQGRWKWIAIAMLPLLVSSGESGMFHDLLIWLAFAGIYAMEAAVPRRGQKAGLFCVGILFVLLVQAIKSDYRQRIWEVEDPNRTEAIVESLREGLSFRDETLDSIVTRFNQGWIVSAVMQNIPDFQPYLNGETILEAAKAALVPRVVDAGKAVAGGQDNFSLLTGLALLESTSMGVSPLGETYANFGPIGGAIALGIWGTLLGYIIHCVQRAGLRQPLWLYLLPVMVYQAIKAETEFLTVFNQLTKGSFVILVCYWLITHYVFKDRGRLGNAAVNQRRIDATAITPPITMRH